jgi:hypothetical protein
MKNFTFIEQVKTLLGPQRERIPARLFVTRDDGITVFDTVQDATTSSVAALVSGVWQASEAMMGMVDASQDVMDFRLGFDTSSQGVLLFPFRAHGKKYFLGAIYRECLNPGQLKRQVSQLKEHLSLELGEAQIEAPPKPARRDEVMRDEFLFKDISDEEIDRLFSIGGL